MLTTLMHSESGLNLPFPPDMGAAVLGVGLVVLAVITYDIYQQHWAGDGT
ncbi:hypothetical protein BDK61_2331 [Haloarcula quadrata]|uniref:Uncharacterized protein n=5 Tax=Haloarcula TaxID=2237 RepID=Q5V2J4_HALMA|nr:MULTISPECIES: hypothetical protein [Haloarcula]AAV46258.1 unknown [Haloarcula marismortui ATCC 43049]NHN64875.1 hypothetical protein [Haloarcula sp. JP-Z28]NHX41232.1 hypothetical protein [Haloarcula sp. R1-2]QUJ72903.1 hypothetical protein KDQ40_03900 [Haloarcula sinaiiensis ATCC 33800]RKS83006.1 hypothetical protein BDK61_2331 [Haloarcula quadrata]